MIDRCARALAALAGVLWASGALADEGPVSFRRQVAPILVTHCLGCHSAEDAQGGLSLETIATLRQGGAIEGEAILEPGEPAASHLVAVLKPTADPRMPMKADPLSDAQIGLIETWVAEGAKFDGLSEETRIEALVDPLAGVASVAPMVSVSDPVSAVAYSVDGRLAAARGETVHLFGPSATLDDHPGPVNFLAFGPGGKTLVAAGGKAGLSGFLVLWDMEKQSKLAESVGLADAVLAGALSPDGKVLATAGYDRLVRLWDVASMTETRVLKEHTDAVYDVAFSPGGETLASASGDRTVKTWDPATGMRLASLGDATAELHAVAFAPDGKGLLAAGADKRIWSWRLDGEAGRLEASPPAHEAAVLRLAIASSGDRLVSTGEDRGVKVWELPGLQPLATLPAQPDWPMAVAFAPGGSELAVGRYDGSLSVLPLSSSGGPATVLLEAPAPPARAPKEEEAKKPELRRDATLGPPSIRVATPGSKPRLALSGRGVGNAAEIVFDDPTFRATIVREEKARPDALQVDLEIPAESGPGLRRFWVRTPEGVPAPQPFLIARAAETPEAEPNSDAGHATAIALPATLAGAIAMPGDVDCWKFVLKAGQAIVALERGKSLGSTLDPEVELRDGSGAMVASVKGELRYVAPAGGEYLLRVADAQYGGSGNHFYRIEIGEASAIDDAFPRGVQVGPGAVIEVAGMNLGATVVRAEPPAGTTPGTVVDQAVPPREAGVPGSSFRIVAGEGPQAVEAEPNNQPAETMAVAAPGGVSGRIDGPGDLDIFRFEAKAGRPVVVEVFGQRIGSEVDPVLEILDAQGRPVTRAVLRPVAETTIAFRDHNSRQEAIRLTKWDELRTDDYLLVGRELMRIFALPRNPDDDARFWSAGGRRLGYLGTTPEQHPMARPMRKVEIHPPGASFPAGAGAIEVPYRNDDGGPGLGPDSLLPFVPPADGEYLARVSDARGLGGPGFVYHLLLREPRPGLELSLSAENVNIPRGTTAPLTAEIRRVDGFEGPVDLRVEGLPPGFTATTGRIEPGHFSASLAISADADAPAFSPPTWRVVAEASDGPNPLRREVDPGGPSAGWVTATPPPDLKVFADRDRVVIRPGEEVRMEFRVERSAAFAGRVPIDVLNLPHGVRVLDIGLNGVLITEKEDRREVVLYAEPWVEPTERPFVAVGRVEAAGMASGASPITLVVEPPSGGETSCP